MIQWESERLEEAKHKQFKKKEITFPIVDCCRNGQDFVEVGTGRTRAHIGPVVVADQVFSIKVWIRQQRPAFSLLDSVIDVPASKA